MQVSEIGDHGVHQQSKTIFETFLQNNSLLSSVKKTILSDYIYAQKSDNVTKSFSVLKLKLKFAFGLILVLVVHQEENYACSFSKHLLMIVCSVYQGWFHLGVLWLKSFFFLNVEAGKTERAQRSAMHLRAS